MPGDATPLGWFNGGPMAPVRIKNARTTIKNSTKPRTRTMPGMARLSKRGGGNFGTKPTAFGTVRGLAAGKTPRKDL